MIERKLGYGKIAGLIMYPLATRFPRMYNLAFKKCLTVYTVKQEGWGVIRFRRLLYGETLE
jgi:hypothetical protein